MAWADQPTLDIATWPATKGFQDWQVYNNLILAFRERAIVAQKIVAYKVATDFTTYNPWGGATGVSVFDASVIATFQQDILDLVQSGCWLRESALISGSMQGLNPVNDLIGDVTDLNGIIW